VLSQTFFRPHPRPSPSVPTFSTSLSSSRRSISEIPPRTFSDKYPVISICTRLFLSTALGLGLVVGVILLHDAFTYSERHADRVPANPLALKPRRGGKKNLPILEVKLDEEEDDVKVAMKDKPRIVIIGGGWGVSQPFPM
jgi:NADH dehydrogenase